MAVSNMFRPDDFLGIFKLETGGTIIGAIGIFYALFQLLIDNILFFSLIFTKNFCPQRHFIEDDTNLGNLPEDTQHQIKSDINYAQKGVQYITKKAQQGLQAVTGNEYSCTTLSKIPVGAILLFAMAFNCLSIFVHYKLIKGVEKFDPKKFRFARKFYILFIIIRVIFIIAGLIWMFWVPRMIYLAILSFILLLVDIYIYTIINNLRIKYENFRPVNTETQNIPMKEVKLAEPEVVTVEKLEL